MVKAVGRNTLLVGGLLIGAGVSGTLARWMVTPTGSLGPLVSDSVSLFGALAAVVLAMAVATLAGIVVGRATNTAVGMFTLGGALFGLAWRTGTVQAVSLGDGSLVPVAIETALWALLMLGSTLLVFRFSGPLPDVEPDANGVRPHPLFSRGALKALACGALVLPVVWIMARTSMKGQVIGAAFCGAMVVGLAGRLLVPNLQPVVLFAAPVLFGAIGHVIAAMMLGSTSMREAGMSDMFPSLGYPMPIDYMAGSAMGVSWGLGWAKSFLHHEEPGAAAGSPERVPEPLTITTNRLVLRAPRADDVQAITVLAGHPEIAATTVRIPHPYRPEHAEQFIEQATEGWASGESAVFVIVQRDGDVLMGAVGIDVAPAHRHGEMGYWVGRHFWNHGYATEAASAALDHAFTTMGLHRVHAHHFGTNPASGRVLQRIGMTAEGVLRQHIVKSDRYEDITLYGILRSEHVPGHAERAERS